MNNEQTREIKVDVSINFRALHKTNKTHCLAAVGADIRRKRKGKSNVFILGKIADTDKLGSDKVRKTISSIYESTQLDLRSVHALDQRQSTLEQTGLELSIRSGLERCDELEGGSQSEPDDVVV